MTQTVNGGRAASPVTEQSTGQLVQHASEQFTRLVREELALARAEMRQKARRAGMGAGLIGTGGMLALYGIGALVLAAILGLAVVLPGWLAALLVGVAVLLLAGFMAMIGLVQVRSSTPPTPELAAQSMRDDVDTMTAAVRERGSIATDQADGGRPPARQEGMIL